MNHEMTVEDIDREMRDLREEWGRIVGRLHSPGVVHPPGVAGVVLTPTMRLENIDLALERLRAKRRRAVAALRDPDESATRRERRGVVFARWVETLEVTPARMRRMRALADASERALFADSALCADGWRCDTHGHWHGPLSPGACEGPVTDVVVLAQARAEVDRTLEPSLEETLSSAERVALDAECDPFDDFEPPAPSVRDESGASASLDAANAPALDAEYAALMAARFGVRRADGAGVDPYLALVEARARELVAERVAEARAAMEASGDCSGGDPTPPTAPTGVRSGGHGDG